MPEPYVTLTFELEGGTTTAAQDCNGGQFNVFATAGDGTSGAGGFDGSTATLQLSMDGGTTYLTVTAFLADIEFEENGMALCIIPPCKLRWSCSAGTIVTGVGYLVPVINRLVN